jgi:hypothetical protein
VIPHQAIKKGNQVEEKIFLSEGGVKVTNARFIVSSQTFAMSGITSINVSEDKPSRTVPAVIIALGIIALLGGKAFLPYAIAVIAVGSSWFALQKSVFHVLLTTASGEAKALTSNNKKWITKVITALNDSIVHRG